MTESDLIWKQYNGNRSHVGNGIQDLPIYPMPKEKTAAANGGQEKGNTTYVK